MSVYVTMLEQLAFNPQNLGGHASLATLSFRKNFKGVMFGVSLGTCLSNLKSITLTVFEQLAFNAQKYWGNVTIGMPPFEKFLKGHVRTVPGNVFLKFEVRIFNHIGTISI